MALTHTPDPALGESCPEFKLPAVDGQTHQLSDYRNKPALLVMFICNHCPYVKAIEDRLIALGKDLIPKGLGMVAISSNNAAKYPEDSFENMRKLATAKAYPFAYLYDESQEVAHRFGAVCTPDFFLYDQNLKLAYRGRLDDSWKDASLVSSQELRAAIEALLRHEKPSLQQKPSMGCSIKWKEHD